MKKYKRIVLLLIILLGLISCNKDYKLEKIPKFKSNNLNILDKNVDYLIQIENMGIPNLWGIIPGETSWKRAKFIFNNFYEEIHGPFFEGDNIVFEVMFLDAVYNKQIFINFYCNDEFIIEEIVIPNFFMNFQPISFENPKHITVEEMISFHGIPSKIIVEDAHYMYGLYITFNYKTFTYSFFTKQTKPDINGNFKACFVNNPYIVISSHDEPFLNTPYIRTELEMTLLNEVSNLSNKDFSEKILDNPEFCLEFNDNELYNYLITKIK